MICTVILTAETLRAAEIAEQTNAVAGHFLCKALANWSDIVNFEVHAVITSKEAAERIASTL